ncbi:TPA: hypothetical protein RY759_000784 [Staphylococcus aureus]|nr:hypothetical protein [Staphylococcus aureus]HDG8499706.1 hypothetical protein [Staphylococcus aureus]HDG8587393.1 hypothetical protein [Staphylococcus aureus]HDZ3300504.1 hypothetical protein [Staphylococcus aureus]HDZ3316091.1 hypothetical protein [Staphylococcus aureus]
MGGDLIVKIHICFVVKIASGCCYINKREAQAAI